MCFRIWSRGLTTLAHTPVDICISRNQSKNLAEHPSTLYIFIVVVYSLVYRGSDPSSQHVARNTQHACALHIHPPPMPSLPLPTRNQPSFPARKPSFPNLPNWGIVPPPSLALAHSTTHNLAPPRRPRVDVTAAGCAGVAFQDGGAAGVRARRSLRLGDDGAWELAWVGEVRGGRVGGCWVEKASACVMGWDGGGGGLGSPTQSECCLRWSV